MKQKSIFELVLGVILVLTLSGTEDAFADYDEYDDDRDDEYEKENDRNDDDRNDDRNDSDDKWKKEKRS